MSPHVFIIILQYNRSQDTTKCLDSIGKLTYPNFQTIVVDNASESTEKYNIKNHVKSQGNIVVLENEKNLGYAGGNNVGIKYALEHGADYVFILNNDTTVEPDLLSKLVTTTEEDTKVGIVGPAIKEGDGRVAYYGKISWLKAELKHVYKKSEIHPLENSRAKSRGSRVGGISDFLGPKEYVIGAAMLIKKEVLEKIDGFDEIYFLYFEDADLCLRAQLAGYRLKIAPETTIYHQVSASTSALGKPLILRYHMRNALIFNSLNGPWPVKFSLIFWSAYILLKNFVKVFLFPAKVPAGEAIIDGVLDFYKNRYGQID
ncbi:MAG: glycosyltransferase family 2 protein [bacterium]|nr:glycosyltransferase family 2 protein [bacterium]